VLADASQAALKIASSPLRTWIRVET